MLVTKSKAAELAGISRRTFYNHIDKKGISISQDQDGIDKIDVSELKRVYGQEVILHNLQKLENLSEQSREVKTGDGKIAQAVTQPDISFDKLILEEKLKSAEVLIEQLRSERDRLHEDSVRTREQLDKALEIGAPIGKLLEDHREGRDHKSALQEEKIRNMETMMENLKEQNERLIKLEEQRRARALERQTTKQKGAMKKQKWRFPF